MLTSERYLTLARMFAHQLRAQLGSHLKEIILFGSVARGESTEASDVDVLVVVDERTAETEEASLDAAYAILNSDDIVIAPLVYGQREWQAAASSPLSYNIRQEGVHL